MPPYYTEISSLIILPPSSSLRKILILFYFVFVVILYLFNDFIFEFSPTIINFYICELKKRLTATITWLVSNLQILVQIIRNYLHLKKVSCFLKNSILNPKKIVKYPRCLFLHLFLESMSWEPTDIGTLIHWRYFYHHLCNCVFCTFL